MMIQCTRPDIVIGTETHCDGSVGDKEIFPSNYKLFRKDRNRRGGGVLIATTEDLVCTRASELETNCEMLWVKVKTKGQRSLLVGAFYRPDVSDSPSLEALYESLGRAVSAQNATVLVGGDFNLPSWNWGQMELKPDPVYPAQHRTFVNTVQDLGLQQMVEFNTRGNNTLDLMLTNSPDLVPRVEPLPGLSDHEGVYLELQVHKYKRRQVPRNILLFNKADWDSLRDAAQKLSISITSRYTVEGCTEEIWEDFKTGLLEAVQKTVPSKRSSPKSSHPWITIELKKLIRRRDRLYRKMKKRGDKILKEEVRKLKCEIQRKTRRSYWQHLQNLFTNQTDEQQTPTKKFWAHIKSTRSENIGVSPLKENGKLITEPAQQANLLNRQFQSAFSSATMYNAEEFRAKCPLPPPQDSTQLGDLQITTEGVEKLLHNLNPHKACGPDNISPRVLQALASELAPALTLIFRSSLLTGVVPQDWRTAYVTPIFKKGERYRPENYRPISLTSIACKVMEHIIVSHIMRYAEGNGIIVPEQHGFRQGRSCETQLLGLVDELTFDLEAGKQVDLIVLDFQKAFDKVNHSLLSHKLEHYGIKGRISAWIGNFLKNRQQAVVVDGAISSFVPVDSGVPQGSVLGPALFLLYINDLPQQIDSGSRLFADDTICQRCISADKDQTTLQEDLHKLEAWENSWEMRFHPAKCQVLHATKSKKRYDQTYFLHGQLLQEVSTTKYLGVTLSADLSWEPHINATINKASRMLGFLRRSLKISAKGVKDRAYKAYVRPLLEYSASVWDPHQDKYINNLEGIQRRAARWVCQRYRRTSSVEEMLTDLEWPTLQSRRRKARLTNMFKYHTELISIESQHAPSSKTSIRRARRNTNSKCYPVPSCRTDYRKYSFFPRTITEWNALPEKVVLAHSVEAFVNHLP